MKDGLAVKSRIDHQGIFKNKMTFKEKGGSGHHKRGKSPNSIRPSGTSQERTAIDDNSKNNTLNKESILDG